MQIHIWTYKLVITNFNYATHLKIENRHNYLDFFNKLFSHQLIWKTLKQAHDHFLIEKHINSQMDVTK